MARYSRDMIIAAAHFYYIEGFTQEETARHLNVSRVMVTRLLKRARETGVVQISLTEPLPVLYDLALGLEKKTGLKVVRVVQTGASQEETVKAMGEAGAEILESLVKPGCRIGVAWSQTVHSVLPYIRKPADVTGVVVNELAGTYLAPDIPYSVSWPLAEKLGVPLESIPLPLLVKNKEARDAMLREETIQKALNNAKQADFVFAGLGEVSGDSSLVKSGYISMDYVDELRERGAVGDLLMNFFDRNGNRVDTTIGPRTISLEWEHIQKLPLIIVMAFGPSKLESIRGALKGGLVQGLITDRKTAEALLSE